MIQNTVKRESLDALTSETNVRDWMRRLSRFGQKLRWEQGSSLADWVDVCFAAMDALLSEETLIHGALYFKDDDDALRLGGGYALAPDMPDVIPLGSGLLGQAAKTRRPFFFHEGSLYQSLATTTLFCLRPRAGVAYPLIFNDKLLGLIEFHTLKSLAPEELESFAELLAANIDAIQNQLRIEALLTETAVANRRLQAREKELEEKIMEMNRIQERLEVAQGALASANQTLEEEVRRRTADLEAAMQNLETTYSQLVLSEKMAALGTLIAGVAHEINSPLGAIRASNAVIADIMPLLAEEYPRVLSDLDVEDRGRFIELVRAIFKGTPQNFTSAEERRLRRRYETILAETGAEDPFFIAQQLVEAGFQGALDDYLPLFKNENFFHVLEVIYNLGQLKVNTENINLAADKAKKVVFALKNYAYAGEQNELVAVNLRDNIETVLTIYHNQLKYGIELTVNFEEVDIINGYPDELSQVWTNLLQNAVQAMNGQGAMHIRMRQSEAMIYVEIEDEGPGVPETIRERIFEPFYTTKKRGEGTGLGLHICRKIIERHNGVLSLENKPTGACFTVVLPAAV